MSPTPSPSAGKSSLRAARGRGADASWGSVIAPPPRVPTDPFSQPAVAQKASAARVAPAPRETGQVSSAATKPVPRQKAKPVPKRGGNARTIKVRAAKDTSSSDVRSMTAVITVILTMLFTTAAGFGGVKVTQSVQERAARQSLDATLGRAAFHQAEYRGLNERFATWPELEEKGAILPEGMTVLQTNATPSHWYLQMKDSKTGLVCERLGELFDNPNELGSPTCRRPDAGL